MKHDRKPEVTERPPAEGGENLLELILAEPQPRVPAPKIDGVVIGTLVALGAGGEPQVDFVQNATREPVMARTMVAVTAVDVGREVALLFEGADPTRPVLMGLMFTPAVQPPVVTSPAASPGSVPQAERDGERLVFEADKEIVLKCGDSSITLTRAGKILIKGAYLLTRSTGVNRIQGGTVEIN